MTEDGISLGTRLEDVAYLPEFGRFGRMLIPGGTGRIDGLTMGDIGTLMPYHSNVRPEDCVRTIESMRGLVRDGRLSMLPQRRTDDGTGVFLFKGRVGALLVIAGPTHTGSPWARSTM